MINSIGGANFFGTYPGTVKRNASPVKAGQFLDSLNSDTLYGITEQQKDYLKNKYGSSDLSLCGEDAHKFMSELRDMGVISNQDLFYYNAPSWRADKPKDYTSYGSSSDRYDIIYGDIRNSFRFLSQDQKHEASFYIGESRNYFLERSDMYSKLADIMDYIFK